MFNEKLVLPHYNNLNPYGLSKDGVALNYDETVNYFKEINITDHELELLNNFIREDSSNSFYSNAYCMWYENGYAMSFIDGYRAECEFLEQFKLYDDSNASYICRYKDSI